MWGVGTRRGGSLALVMFQHLLDPQRYALELVSPVTLTTDVVSLATQQDVALIGIVALPPGTTTPTRYLCKRLCARFPACNIIVGSWGWTGERAANQALLLAAGADAMGTTLQESRNQVGQWSLSIRPFPSSRRRVSAWGHMSPR
jgi:hypothetical protein